MDGINRSFPLDLLSEGWKSTSRGVTVSDGLNLMLRIKDVFEASGIKVRARSIPYYATSVLRFEFVPNSGMKMANIHSCKDKLNEALSYYGPIRLIAPVPGKGTIAVEVPRPDRQIVRLREVLESKEFQESEAHLPVALGIDSENNTVVADLAKMPHLLIAGAAGQGKSMLINSIILSLLYRLSPADLKLVLIDPKQEDLSPYDKIKTQYLLGYANESTEVITSLEKVSSILNAIACEVDVRFRLFIKAGCRNIREYNKWITDGRLSIDEYHPLPYIVVVIDEFADLKMSLEKDFEGPLARIAAKARAVGIHLVIATQRPSTDIITGVIKANFPTRIAFKVGSEIDSKTILDTNGAEVLLGMGDMLVNYNSAFKRIQSCFVDTEPIEQISYWIAQNLPNCSDSYFMPIFVSESSRIESEINNEQDSLFLEAARSVVRTKKSYINISELIKMLNSDDIEDQDNEAPVQSSGINMANEDSNAFESFINREELQRLDEPYKFPYEQYKIIGDTAEIDKIFKASGYINIDIGDIESTLSKETINYVSTGKAGGPNCIVNALAEALDKLPIEINTISKLLYNIWTPKDMPPSLSEGASLADFFRVLPADIDIIWGIAFDESMKGQLARVSLIAASK